VGLLRHRFWIHIFRLKQALLRLQNSLYTFQARRRGEGQSFSTGVLQADHRIVVRQLQEGHAGFVTLLLYLVSSKEYSHNSGSIFANRGRPAKEPFTVPLEVSGVLRRHMLLKRTVLIGAAIQPKVGGHSGTAEIDFYSGAGESYIHFLFDVFVTNEEFMTSRQIAWHRPIILIPMVFHLSALRF
jgi:hypothetical protein